jgi:hypothetical protein
VPYRAALARFATKYFSREADARCAIENWLVQCLQHSSPDAWRYFEKI